MKIYKSQYGWSTTAHHKTMEGETKRCFMDVSFKRGEEPLGEEIEGKLIFRQVDGTERECFFSSYEKQGTSIPKLVVLGMGRQVQTTLGGTNRDLTGHTDVAINPEELPFY